MTIIRANWKVYLRLWSEICNIARNSPHDTPKERVQALLIFLGYQCIFNILIALPTLLVFGVLVWVISWASIHAVVIGILILFFSELFALLFKKPQVSANPLVWDNIAIFVVCPVFNQVWKREFSKEMVVCVESPLFGVGYYYSFPSQLSDELQRKALQRKLEKKYSEYVGVDLQTVIRRKTITVTGDLVFFKVN